VAKEYVTIIVGVLTLLAASAAVYEILTVNTQIQAKPEQIKVPDYSAELDSLKSQIGSVSSNLTSLDTLKSKMVDIQGKLAGLENKYNQATQLTYQSPTLAVVLDKSSYFPGDTIKITAIGANPLKLAQVELLDNSGSIVISSQTWSDSKGNILYDLQLSSSLLAGNYQVKLISDQQTETQPITIVYPSTSYNPTTGLYTFTARTDKSLYQTGDLIEVSGTGQPNSAVTGVLTSPTGKTYTSNTTIQPDGTYHMFYSTSQPYETGSWYITLSNLGQTKVIYTTVASSSSYGFTAQTDKSTYKKGETIVVSGTGQPNTTVTGIMTSDSENTYNSAATVRSDGTYDMFFPTSSSYETGTWHVTLNNVGQTALVYFYMS
jgi:hypothetical protein